MSKRLRRPAKVGDEKDKASPYLPRATLPRDPPTEPIAIADMAELFGVTHRTLHFYEEKGLLSASRMGLMRVYSRQDLERMALITACREIGMPIAVIQELLDELKLAASQEEADDLFEQALRTRKRELTSALSTIQRQSQQIERLLSAEEEDETEAASQNIAIALSEVERHCLQLMAEGYATTRLARALDLKTDEINAIEASIIRKFEANNRFQAVAKAVLLGIVAS